MTVISEINLLTLLVMILLLVAAVLLIMLLWRANRLMYKMEHLPEAFGQFIKEAVPAVVNMGTVATAAQEIFSKWLDHKKSGRRPEK